MPPYSIWILRCEKPERPGFLWLNKSNFTCSLNMVFVWVQLCSSIFLTFTQIIECGREKGNQEEITHRLPRLISSQDPEAKPRLHSPKVNIQLLVIGTWFKEKSHWAKHFGLILRICTNPSHLVFIAHDQWHPGWSWWKQMGHRQGGELKM